jgi:hypothetical protein
MRPRACADACEVPLRRPQTENRADSTFGFSVEFGVRAESKKHGRGRRSPNGVQIGLSSLLFLAIMSGMIRPHGMVVTLKWAALGNKTDEATRAFGKVTPTTAARQIQFGLSCAF